MITKYSKLDGSHFCISAYSRGKCLAEIVIVVDRCNIPKEYHITNFDMVFYQFCYWYSSQLAIPFSEVVCKSRSSSLSDCFDLFL